jgi:hypothetical protein
LGVVQSAAKVAIDSAKADPGTGNLFEAIGLRLPIRLSQLETNCLLALSRVVELATCVFGDPGWELECAV